VLINLLDNAVKFTPEEGRISLGVHLNAERTGVELHVKDQGIGIPSSDLPRILSASIAWTKRPVRGASGTVSVWRSSNALLKPIEARCR
jgi:signal transduction histidine kinase